MISSKRILKGILTFVFIMLVHTQVAFAAPNSSWSTSSVTKINANTVQVKGYFYNAGTSRYYGVNNFYINVKDVNGHSFYTTINDSNLNKVSVNPKVKVPYTFNIKVYNLKNYNFKKWSYTDNFKFKCDAPITAWRTLDVIKTNANTVQVKGYFYNTGTSKYYGIKDFYVNIKDAKGHNFYTTINNSDLSKICVDAKYQVQYTFNVKVYNLKNYDLKKWLLTCKFKYSW